MAGYVSPNFTGRRVQRVPPRIELPPFRISLADGSEGRVQVVMPRGSPPDVRANQALEIKLQEKEVVRVSYLEALQYLKVEVEIDAAYRFALQQFVAAVDKAVPNDAHNLVHTVGVDRVASVCKLSSPRILVDRLSAKSPWTADELALLRLTWPDFDVVATVLRTTYWRVRKRLGPFSDAKAAPGGMAEYAATRNLPPFEEDKEPANGSFPAGQGR